MIAYAVTLLSVPQGGTGAGSFSNYPIVGNGLNPLTASSTLWVVGINATSTTATSTFAFGVKAAQFDATTGTSTAKGWDLSAGCFAINGTCLGAGGSGTVTSIATTWPITGGTITTTGTLSFNGLSTSTAAVIGNIPYFSGVNSFANVATSTIGAGTGLTFSGTAGYQVGGTNGTYSVNTSQNIATLSNLTGNGFVKTSGGAGTLSVDTSTYLTTVDISANTNLAVTAPVVLTGDTLSLGNVTLYPAFSYATSTWNATTTKQLGTATVAETWTFAECYTTIGTLNISFSDGTNLMNMISASSTPARFALSSNNSFTAGEKRQFAIGTPATAPVEVACTITKTLSIN